MQGKPLVTASVSNGELRLAGAGEWTLANAKRLEAELDEASRRMGPAQAASLDVTGVDRFDTYGAWLLERFRRQAGERGATVATSGVRDRDQPLFDEVSKVNRGPKPGETARRAPGDDGSLAGPANGVAGSIVSFAVMTGALFSALGRVLVQPSRFRVTATIHQFDRVGWQAVPIVLMITFLIGAIVAQQGFFHFRRFGADLYVVDMIGFLVMRELGVLLVAIMVAGRSGSSYTAELGSMKMREEIDALRTMGLDPAEILVLPRILVMVVVLPILTFLGCMAALVGAGLVATLYAGMGFDLFVDRLRESISLDHFLVGLIKAPFIGFVIGVIACNEGLATSGSAASLGRRTTMSVVKAIFMVIAMDGLFALFFSAIRM